MAENEIVRKKGLVSLVLLLVLVCPDAGAQGVSWNRTMMDGSRTGCTSPLSDNVEQSIGVVKGRRYYAPNGRVFRGGTVGKVARVVLEAQPSMAVVKTVIGRSSAEMIRHKPECALFDWFADLVMVQVAGLAGKPVDASITIGDVNGIMEPQKTRALSGALYA